MEIHQTADFYEFINNILRYRCLLSEKTVSKYFNTEQGRAIMSQVFIHKSLGNVNYDLMEFAGDTKLNEAVRVYIMRKYPQMTSVDQLTKIKHKLISGKMLAKLAIDHGFDKYLVYGEELHKEIALFTDPTYSEKYMAMLEDTVEAMCGALEKIIDPNMTLGVSMVACYNLIWSFLDEIDVPIEYSIVVDAKTRLKETIDYLKWDKIKYCTLKESLRVLERKRNEDGTFDNNAIEKYIQEAKNARLPLDPEIVNSTKRFIALGYLCVSKGYKGEIQVRNYKTLVVASTGHSITSAEMETSEKLIKILNSYGFRKPDPKGYIT